MLVAALTATAQNDAEVKKVAPLCTTQWAQEAPYNNMCPAMDGKRCVTGCVITAAAQIMRKHKYPAKGSGKTSYEWNGQTLSADFSQSSYQWDQMLDHYTEGSYSEEQGNAVALLMRDLGYAINMDYTTIESGTSDTNMTFVLWFNFGYDLNIRQLKRDYCTLEEFCEVIRKELDEGRPVLMGGSDNGGHSFVCDGYDEQGRFHINYGWGGNQDDYYHIGPDMPYSSGLVIFYGIQPDKGGTQGITGMSNKDFAWKEGDVITCALHVVSTIVAVDIEVALAAKNTTTNEVQYFAMTGDGEQSQCLKDRGVTDDQYKSFTFDKSLADGTYQLYPVCRVKGEKSWQTFYFYDKRQRYVDLTVSGGVKTYANKNINDELDEGKVEKDGIYYILDEEKQEATVTFKNNRYNSYKGEVTIPSTITISDKTYAVTTIGKDAFNESTGLTSVTIGANVKTIQRSFFYCSNLKTIEFAQGSKLESIEGMTFQSCYALEAIELPEGIKTINQNVFNECHSLVRVVIPRSVNSINDNAFDTNSNNLHMYVAWENPEKEVQNGYLNKNTDQISTWTLHVPKGTKEKYQNADGWKEFGTIIDDNTTGIVLFSDGRRKIDNVDSGWYTLDGRKVDTPKEGLYIHNGKKVVIK